MFYILKETSMRLTDAVCRLGSRNRRCEGSPHGRIAAKTLAILTLSVAGSTLDASGQALVGFKAGVAVTDVRGEDAGDHSARADFIANFFAGIGPRQGLSLQLEVSYVQRGTVEKDLDDGIGTTFPYGTWEYRYWDIAALPRFTVGSGRVRGALFGGPYIGTVFDATLTTEQGETRTRVNTEPLDLGGVVGASIETETGFLIDVRYMAGFGEIDRAPFDRIYQRKHSVLAVMIGMTLG